MSGKDTVQDGLKQAEAGQADMPTVEEDYARQLGQTGPRRKDKKGKKEKVKKSVGREILEWVLTIVVAVVAALIIRSFIFELVRVEGGSMQDTLENKEIMFVSKFDYSSTWLSLPFQSNNAAEQAPRITFGTPKRLDVVICRYPTRGTVNFVKRIVGMPGEYVSLKGGYLYINGTQVADEAAIEGIPDSYRKGGIAYTYPLDGSMYYVPKKGDKVVISQDSSADDGISLTIRGDSWNRMRTCLVMKTADGKTLKLYDRNTDDGSREAREYDETTRKQLIYTETVFTYDGKTYTPAEFCKQYPDLIGQELTVDEDYYFVMGDHRNNSNDSRSVGALERSAIIGHARSVVFPFNAWRGVK